MPFKNIAMDVGAAINAYLLTWNDPTRFDKVTDHEITLKILKFMLNLIEKVNPDFFIFLNVYVSRFKRDKILISQLSSPNFRYFAGQNGPTEGGENGVISLVFLPPSRVVVLKLSKWCLFCKKSLAVIAISVYESERSRFVLLENGTG